MTFSWQSVLTQGRNLWHGFTHLVYPPSCWVCGQFIADRSEPVCAVCLPQLINDPLPTCPRCSSSIGPHLVLKEGCPDCRHKSFAFDGAYRMRPYQGLLRDVILRMKHWSGEELVEVIGAVWAKQMAVRLQPLQPEVVIPVPLHWTRRSWRGFNQSAILSTHLAQQLHIPCMPRALQRVRWTRQQKQQQSETARQSNVHQAFQARHDFDLANKTLLLVDDVLTSGATANESARALRQLRPKAIYVVVLAHGS